MTFASAYMKSLGIVFLVELTLFILLSVWGAAGEGNAVREALMGVLTVPGGVLLGWLFNWLQPELGPMILLTALGSMIIYAVPVAFLMKVMRK